MQRKYYRMRELASVPGRDGMLPVTPATVWRWVAAGSFPQPVRLGPGVTAWPADAVDAWLQRQAGLSHAPRDVGRAVDASVKARQAKREGALAC